MLILKAQKRKLLGKKVKKLRQKGVLPAILYGPKTKNLSLKLDLKEFERIYKEAGGTSLLSLEVENDKFLVLVHDIKKDPLTGRIIHVDFLQPILTEEIEATVPIVFEGEAPAVKDLEATLIKEIQEVEVKALPQNLPHEIKVNIERLKTFEDEILIKDLKVAENVKILREPNEIVAVVVAPETEKIEKELEKPIEEKVEEAEEVEEKIEEKEEIEEEKPKEEKDEK